MGRITTGRVIIATRRCPQTGRCAGQEYELGPDWPIGRQCEEDGVA